MLVVYFFCIEKKGMLVVYDNVNYATNLLLMYNLVVNYILSNFTVIWNHIIYGTTTNLLCPVAIADSKLSKPKLPAP